MTTQNDSRRKSIQIFFRFRRQLCKNDDNFSFATDTHLSNNWTEHWDVTKPLKEIQKKKMHDM